MKIRVYVSTDKVGSDTEMVMEVEDDCSNEEIEEYAREELFQMIEWGWERVDDNEETER